MIQRILDAKYTVTIPLVVLGFSIILFSCNDKKEYEMELAHQRQLTAHYLYENDRILLRIEKESKDHGERFLVATNHARNVVNIRNRSISSYEMFVNEVDKLKLEKNIEAIAEHGSIELLTRYEQQFNKKHDSLMFQKLVNIYLSIEKNILHEDLMNVSSCSWGGWLEACVSKTTDTTRVGELYELAVIPQFFDHRFTFVHDDCKIIICKNDEPVEVKYTILKKGSVFLISLSPTQPGNYVIRGSFTQSARLHPYGVQLKFVDSFVVNQ